MHTNLAAKTTRAKLPAQKRRMLKMHPRPRPVGSSGAGTGAPPTEPAPASPYLTPEEAATYLRYGSAHALRQATKKLGIPHIRRGYRIFYLRSELDRFMSVVSEATRLDLGLRRRR
jgi:hypothetical protein